MYILMLQVLMPPAGPRYTTQSGLVRFTSDAPLELIEARSSVLRGVLDTSQHSFAFAVQLSSFEGFNDPLQAEHFCEKFLECERYPQATFSGKIIESVPFGQPGVYEVRAKGTFVVHGVSRERIIKGSLTIAEDGIRVRSDFTVRLGDHAIRVPQVVFHNVAEAIAVHIDATLVATGS
ncbi:MAG: hypothetical protein OHK0039_19660 [Bacteroidia bacterium]